jgi:transcriptional regulator with XRE-family HTH domain
MTRIETIRKRTGLNRTKFAERYGIPLRTMEEWEAGRRIPPAYVDVLLDRAVREDFGLPHTYRVTEIGDHDEWVDLKTDNLFEALKRLEDERYINERDKNKTRVEVRRYTHDIDDEECECFDYDIIETWLDIF